MFNRKKYEPKTVHDLVFADDETRERMEDYANGWRTGHMIMHGPKGTGKSSAARVISDAWTNGQVGNCTDPYEGSSFGAEDLDKILNDWSWQRLNGAQMPVTVINEIDLLPAPILEKLKSFMDEHGESGRIIGTTNHEHKLSPALQDRFDIIEVPALPADAFVPRVREIVQAEGYEVTEAEVKQVLAAATGSWRDALSAAEDIILSKKRKPKP